MLLKVKNTGYLQTKGWIIIVVLFCYIAESCSSTHSGIQPSDSTVLSPPDTLTEAYGITDLQPGDILIRPNNNWLPGSSYVPGGTRFGHAAIVIQGALDTIRDSLLAHALLFESNSMDVPKEFQIRKVPGYYTDPDPRLCNHSFGPEYKGICYRLRIHMTGPQRDSILAFIVRQDDKESSWRSIKKYPQGNDGKKIPSYGDRAQWAELPSWYCTLIIWEAYMSVLGIDIDANHGLIVYPNDVIVSPWFNNTPSDKTKRIRF